MYSSRHFEQRQDVGSGSIESPALSRRLRPSVQGKFLSLGEEKFYVRGVTYGPFRPDANGNHVADPVVVDRDFRHMAAMGINSVRAYTLPPRWFLDLAQEVGLKVMIGLPWEQHVTFLDSRKQARDIRKRLAAAVCTCAGHPATLCYAIGNEIPASIVRWHGTRKVERFLEELHHDVKSEDPQGLFTYVNFPTTEYLELPFLEVVCFNVYLESAMRLQPYLARLQNIAGNRPLIMGEIGLDSRRNGLQVQAHALDWQVRTAFEAGCAGAFVFAWTDEWHRGGYDIENWDFGLTDAQRRPKPALEQVRKTFAEVPFRPNQRWPRISVVVCTFNGQRTIGRCLEGLQRLRYPNHEVIVVNDGSTDQTAEIVRRYPVRVISTENRGLSAARNLGMETATGEIIAYLDDDAWPDPDWLSYLANSFLNSDCAAIGGPNLPVSGGRAVGEGIANSPGWPTHVLLSDHEAEHIPGCNMAFRKSRLLAIGGFDTRFRVAGDDVDICWRMLDEGWKLGFSPAAMVWHHCRNSIRAYWKQQAGYGKAEALLEKKWPEKYNLVGHPTWAGRVYNNGFRYALQLTRGRIYQGTWGSAGYGRREPTSPSTLQALPMLPEWHLLTLILVTLLVAGDFSRPLLFILPLLIGTLALPLIGVMMNMASVHFQDSPGSLFGHVHLRAVTAFLHFMHPFARLKGRLTQGLTPWRRHEGLGFLIPRTRTFLLWSEAWQDPIERLESLESALQGSGAAVRRGGDYHDWDLEVGGGMFGYARMRMATEEHGAEKQLVRVRWWPRAPLFGFYLSALSLVSSVLCAAGGAWGTAGILAALALILPFRFLRDSGAASSVAQEAMKALGYREAR